MKIWPGPAGDSKYCHSKSSIDLLIWGCTCCIKVNTAVRSLALLAAEIVLIRVLSKVMVPSHTRQGYRLTVNTVHQSGVLYWLQRFLGSQTGPLDTIKTTSLNNVGRVTTQINSAKNATCRLIPYRSKTLSFATPSQPPQRKLHQTPHGRGVGREHQLHRGQRPLAQEGALVREGAETIHSVRTARSAVVVRGPEYLLF